MAVFSRLLPSLATAYAVQTAFALVFVPRQNDKFYDLGGAVGFLSTTFVSLYYPTLKASFSAGKWIPLPPFSSLAPRQLLLTAGLAIWSARLGSFLVQRALKYNGDSRFDKIKRNPRRFTFSWMAQATWTLLVGLPVYLSNSVPAAAHPPLSARDYAGMALFAGSLLFEVIADHQKSVWRRKKDNKEHDEKFITSGLWSISRHPNYIGEIGIWTGVWLLSTRVLQTPYFPRGTAAMAVVSPLFTYFILTKVSGVPLLEKAGDKKFGDDPKWQHYKNTVPVFWPWGPTK
ncbi:hypothetical protein Moror_12359 [Moniliophthora roreri MCA 2997]|uniref:Uncharacterized protein n=1 Tax=Moniliophthora roreri (strain MCA 2997) TaxID=1381753 RepID=V2XSN7_MONRO|nr:hypothetical protein Moror_12359 [Moniliophthora roreri MCA 2997]KAI3615760.1 hypothetical protein WG66_010205 [Moniliophthora roreri]